VGAGTEQSLAGLEHRTLRYDRLVRKGGSGKSYAQGAMVLAGSRGESLPGEGLGPQLQLGYGLDLPWFSLGLRLSGLTVANSGPEDPLPRRHNEVALAFTLQRFADFEHFSAGFGLLAQAIWHHQSFEGPRVAPARNSLGGGFGGVLSLERHLRQGFALHLEGGPITLLMRRAEVTGGTEVGQSFTTPFTWWLAGGVVWRQ